MMRCPDTSLAAASCEQCSASSCAGAVALSGGCANAEEYGTPPVCAEALGGGVIAPGRLILARSSSVGLVDSSEGARADVCYFSSLDTTFSANAAADITMRRQRFSSVTGVVREYPGAASFNADGSCSVADPREAA